ncbi:MAG: glycosyltransferase family 4 protein, partial [Stellaceae bacterium]
MRILIDLQGAQTDSRSRGLGRYAIGLTKAIIRNRGEHVVCILVNSLFRDAIESIREQFSAILPADRIVVFSVPEAVEALTAGNAWRIAAAELIREWTIDALAPDVLLIPSLFEGPLEPAIVSIGRLTDTKTAVVLHDLIPFLDPDTYLDKGLGRDWYYSKIESLRRADLLLAISTSARREVIDALGLDSERAVVVYSGADQRFTNAKVSSEAGQALLRRFGIQRKFVMHASLIEPRKNFEGLIRAFGLLPPPVRAAHQLVLVGDDGHQTEKHAKQVPLRRLASDIGLAPDDLVFTGHVADDELVALYSLCTLFVFPSFHEGFGLPVLEAMCCGAAVIGSNTTSIPEVVGREDALFDPRSDRSIAQVMERALTDARFR